MEKWILEFTEKQKNLYATPKEYLDNCGEKLILELKKFAEYVADSKYGLYVHVESPYATQRWDYDVPHEEMRKILPMIHSLFPTKTDTYPDGISYRYSYFNMGESSLLYKEVYNKNGTLLSWSMSEQ